ncbi:zinc finger protein with KRAB and SCAN domains 7-like [Armigeres subalbatus]|uniref:zinc finger protein with KRAB and SCAN domains 7-like n=1 Tax=Armigeres subalbatus TaxID=124917 RepID=UPI002ED68CD3
MIKTNAFKKDVMEVCRTCMAANQNKRQRKQIPIFSMLDGAVIANIITECTAVQIDENDALPAVICTECFSTLKSVIAFIKTARISDRELRKIGEQEQAAVCSQIKAEISEEIHFHNIKCEPLESLVDGTGEDAASESDNGVPGNDSDSDWKASDEELLRSVKRTKLESKSKAKRRKRVERQPVQSEDDLKLNEKEQEWFTVITIDPGNHICCGCLQIFKTAEELDTHRSTSHVWKNEKMRKPNSKPLCNGCLLRFKSTHSLNYHINRVRLLKVIWECKKCKLRFKIAGTRRKHLRGHRDDEPVALIARVKETTKQELGWVCCGTKCKESFTTEQDLMAHTKAAHWIEKQEADLESTDKPEQCQVCYRRFADSRGLIAHQKRKYKHRNQQCALCGLKFFGAFDLRAHEAIEHGGREYKCDICDKKYISKLTLMQHVKTIHTDEKPYQCAVCGMRFRLKYGLKTHMSNHIDNPQYKCEVCSKMFKAKLHLRYHMRTHTGERPYKCRFCSHAFANHPNFRRHEMTHTDDKPHKCSHCEKSFILKRMLKEHERTHSGRCEDKKALATTNLTSTKKELKKTTPIKEHRND